MAMATVSTDLEFTQNTGYTQRQWRKFAPPLPIYIESHENNLKGIALQEGLDRIIGQNAENKLQHIHQNLIFCLLVPVSV